MHKIPPIFHLQIYMQVSMRKTRWPLLQRMGAPRGFWQGERGQRSESKARGGDLGMASVCKRQAPPHPEESVERTWGHTRFGEGQYLLKQNILLFLLPNTLLCPYQAGVMAAEQWHSGKG